MIGDTNLEVAKLYNMLPAEEGATSEGRTGEQRDGAHRVRRRARQEDQADADLSDDDRSQFR